MSVRFITLTTDFGEGSPYVAQMKAAALSVNPDVTLLDITHSINPQDIRHGALVLADVTWYFPPDTIHVAVVDPGVGTQRGIVHARIGSQQYVAPDNGLMSHQAQ
ncbi:MAG: SAM-dependent chlorinase/fluorinase, partial [Pirellulaceae bacterium]